MITVLGKNEMIKDKSLPYKYSWKDFQTNFDSGTSGFGQRGKKQKQKKTLNIFAAFNI